MSKTANLKAFVDLSEAERLKLIKEEFHILIKKYNLDLKSLFQIWIDCKNLGLVDSSEKVLNLLIERSIKEKRIWMLKTLSNKLGRRNVLEKKKVDQALNDFSSTKETKCILHENFDVIKIVERNLIYKSLFEAWLESLDSVERVDEIRIIYLGILLHGVSKKTALGLSKIMKSAQNKDLVRKLVLEYDLEKKKTSKSLNNEIEEPEVYLNLAHLEKDNVLTDSKININLIDDLIIKKYLNDVLFSLFCLKDFKGIYAIEEIGNFNFKKNHKEYLSYNFYKLSALVEEKKYRLSLSLIKSEILNLPLTNKEILPFLYLLAESYLGLEKFEKALEIFLMLQEDKIFQGKARIRVNEIKKN